MWALASLTLHGYFVLFIDTNLAIQLLYFSFNFLFFLFFSLLQLYFSLLSLFLFRCLSVLYSPLLRCEQCKESKFWQSVAPNITTAVHTRTNDSFRCDQPTNHNSFRESSPLWRLSVGVGAMKPSATQQATTRPRLCDCLTCNDT